MINEVRPHLIKLGFHTLWQVENHFDHMHVDFQGSASPTGFGGGLGAAGSLTDSFLQVKLVDWDAPAPAGLAGLFVGGPAGSRSGRRTRRSRSRSARSSIASTSPRRSGSRHGRRRSSSPA